MRRWMITLGGCFALLLLLAACGDEPQPNAGDPIPNVRNGLIAMYGGDLKGVDTYFTDEIVLSIKAYANQTAEGNGSIDLSGVTFEVTAKQSPTLWTVTMSGQYSVWLNGQQEIRDTAVLGNLYIGVKIEDSIWKINGFMDATEVENN